MLNEDIYLKIYPDRVVARNLSNGKSGEGNPREPYLHPRLLVGDIDQAELTIQEVLEKVKPTNPLKSFRILIHPIWDFQGGISQAEQRLFRMIGYDARAKFVAIWVGQELGDDGALRRINEG